ncbi:MAG: DUF1524 domain-containing protein [Microbacteriaceae bacterium]
MSDVLPGRHSLLSRGWRGFRRWFAPTVGTWIMIGVAVSLLIIGAGTGAVPGFLVMAGLLGLGTAAFSLITGRRSWAMIASRKAAAITLAACLVTVTLGVNAYLSAGSAAAEHATATPETQPMQTLRATPPVTFAEDDPGAPASPAPAADTASVVDGTVTHATAVALLATLPIKGRAPKTGYNRTVDFGTAWLDVDRNGCDTRNDILARDLTDAVKSGPCKVLSGELAEPYTGRSIFFLRGVDTSALVQIDHLVALSNAWQTGAQQLTEAQRISLANDPLNLLAADGRSNAQKSDGDAATWLPANKRFRCRYVARQVSVKVAYGLWVTQAEHDAIQRILTTCPDEPGLSSGFAPARVVAAPVPVPLAPAPAVPAAPAPAPAAPAPAPAAPAPALPAPSGYYENCAAVLAAGAAPLMAGQPGYSLKLDRDHDGVACE